MLPVWDFLRVTGAGQERLAELQAIATVHSGRHGIAPDVTPAGVVALLGVAGLPPTWLSPPSGGMLLDFQQLWHLEQHTFRQRTSQKHSRMCDLTKPTLYPQIRY